MKKLFSALFSLATVSIVTIAVFAMVKSSEPKTVEDNSGFTFGPKLTATQPKIPKWQGPLNNSGYDVSFPQCGNSLPTGKVGFVIVGLNYGRPFTENPCFKSQWDWAKSYPGVAVYINTSDPGRNTPTQQGVRIALDTVKRLEFHNVPDGTPVWLDVESGNTWGSNERAVGVLQAAINVLTKAGYPIGVYAPPVHWFRITFDAQVNFPTWLALGPYSSTEAGVKAAKAACQEISFGNRVPAIVQFVSSPDGIKRDRNIMCTQPTGLVIKH